MSDFFVQVQISITGIAKMTKLEKVEKSFPAFLGRGPHSVVLTCCPPLASLAQTRKPETFPGKPFSGTPLELPCLRCSTNRTVGFTAAVKGARRQRRKTLDDMGAFWERSSLGR